MRVAYSVLLDLLISEGCPVVNVSRIKNLHEEKKKILSLTCP